MMTYETRIMALLVAPVGERIFSEMATEVRIEDEAGGEFVEVQQSGDEVGKIRISPEDWPAFREAIDQMITACREDKK